MNEEYDFDFMKNQNYYDLAVPKPNALLALRSYVLSELLLQFSIPLKY